MPLTIFNLSTVDHLYIGKDTVIAFAEQPVLETYNIELASEDKIKEHLGADVSMEEKYFSAAYLAGSHCCCSCWSGGPSSGS